MSDVARMSEWLLTALVLLPLAGGGLAALAGRFRSEASRWVALGSSLGVLAIALRLWAGRPAGDGDVFLEQRLPWVPSYGIEYHLALDGLSLLLVLLSALLGVVAVLVSWRELERAPGLHHLCILATLSGILGVFLAWDLFLFYFFWELMLVPMYFLIGVWGHAGRIAAAVKFVVFTMVSGLLLLVAILGLYFAHAAATGVHTFDYAALLGTQIPLDTARWLFLGFVAAFAVKLPLFPVHSWLPDAHTEAPTAGSVLLAGLLLKTGGYGLIRLAFPLFPAAAASLAGPLALLGVVGILYGAALAFSQTDMKRLIAYTSVSHMGFVVLAVSTWRLAALEGAVVQMLAHGVATGALFAIAGMVDDRCHTREFAGLGGLWSRVPILSGFAMVFVLASVGLPGMGNFVGEFMILVGSFPASPRLTVLATAGIVVGTVALLAMMQRAFFGPVPGAAMTAGPGAATGPGPAGTAHAGATADAGDAEGGGFLPLPDVGLREAVLLVVLVGATLSIGIYPQPAVETAGPPLARMQTVELQFDPADPELRENEDVVGAPTARTGAAGGDP